MQVAPFQPAAQSLGRPFHRSPLQGSELVLGWILDWNPLFWVHFTAAAPHCRYSLGVSTMLRTVTAV